MSQLKRLQVMQPCSKPLTACDDGRFLRCDHCPHAVINLVRCTRHQAEQLLSSELGSGGHGTRAGCERRRICCLTRRNQFGELILADGPVRTVRSRFRRLLARCSPWLAILGLQQWKFPTALQAQEAVTYGDVRIASSLSTILTYIEGSLGALVMVASLAMGVMGICALPFIKKRRAHILCLSWAALYIFVALWILRSFTTTYFNDVSLSLLLPG